MESRTEAVDKMLIDTIVLIIVLLIASCAVLHLWINRPRGLIAGEYIKCGSLVCLGEDGKLYNAIGSTDPIDIVLAMNKII